MRLHICVCGFQSRSKSGIYVHITTTQTPGKHVEQGMRKPDSRRIKEAEEANGVRVYIK